MCFLIFSVVLFCATFFGVGFLTSSALRFQLRKSPTLITFLGICIAALFFSIVQFFIPLNILTLICFLLTGGIGVSVYFLKRAANFSNLIDILKTNHFTVMTDLILLLTISIYYCSYGKIFASDTLLYHSSIVSWLNYSKIVPGLANLHARLGMNSAYLILAAGIDTGFFDKYSSSILPAIFLFLTLKYFFELISNNLLSKNAKLMIVILAVWAIINLSTFPTLYYDLPSMIFTAITFIELLLYYEEKSLKPISFDVIFIFAAMSFVIKQSGAIMVIAVFCLGSIELIKNKSNCKKITKFITIPILFGSSYIIRNIIQTGYPLYPLTVFGLPFKWISKDTAQFCLDAIKYWARLPGPNYMNAKTNGFFYWFLPWLKTNISNANSVYFTATLFSFILVIKNIFMLKICGKRLTPFIILLSMISANIVFWFISAPDFRFGSIFFFLLLALSCYYARAEKSTYILLLMFTINILQTQGVFWKIQSVSILTKSNDFFINCLCCMIIGFILYACFYQSKAQKIIAVLILVFVLYNPHDGNLRKKYPAKVQALPCHPVELNNGQNPPLTVFVPNEGDQTGDAELPCTPYPNDKLKLIEPGNIKKGFYIED